MKYESPITYHSKDIANVKDFKKVGQTSRSGGQNFGANRNALS
jgi:hypothetical protein